MEIISANLITLVIVIFVLIIYRYLDKNNRSLEKVKRFTDKIKENLTSFIDEKTAEIQNLSIDMRVNLKTGKEILNRINDVEEKIKKKSNVMDNLHNRMQTYDTLIHELNNATMSVEENLKRIQEESSFVEKVGRRLKESKKDVLLLEKSIPNITKEIYQQNQANLKDIKDKMLNEIKARLETAQQDSIGMEKRIKDFSTYITRLESRRDSIEQEMVKKLENISNSFEASASERKAQLAKEFQSYIEGILRKFNDQKNEIKESIEQLIVKADSEVDIVEERFLNRIIEFKKDIEQMEMEYQTNLRKVVDAGKNLEHDIFNELKQKIKVDSEAVFAEVHNKIDSFAKEVEIRRNEVITILAKTKQNTEVWRTEVGKKLQAIRIDMNAEIKTNKTEIKTEIENVLNSQRESMKTFKIEHENFIEESNYKMGVLEKDLSKKHEKMLADIKVLENLGKDSSGQIKKIKNDLRDASSEMLGNIDDFKNTFSQNIMMAQEEVENNVMESIEKRITEYEEDMKYRFDKLEKVNLDMEELELNLRDFMEIKKDNVKQDFQLFIASLDDRQSKEKEAAILLIEGLRGEIKELDTEVKALKTKTYQNVSEKLHLFEDEFFNDIKERSSNMDMTMNEWQKSIAGQLNSIEQTSIQKRKQLEELFNANFKKGLEDLKTNAKEELKGLQAQMEAVIEDLRENFEGQKDQIVMTTNKERAEIKSELEEFGIRIDELRNKLNEKTHEVFDKFHNDYDKFKFDFNEQINEIQSNFKASISVFEKTIKNNHELSKEMKDRIFEKIEDEYGVLKEKLDNIEKQQKDFVSQTKLFKRADTLKQNLTDTIDELRKDIKDLDSAKKKIGAIDSELIKVNKTSEDINNKVTKFFTEKRRIDEMERNFNRLVKMSGEVDNKLKGITVTYDTLQEIQIKIRELGDLGKKVQTQYERLDNKNKIIDTTTKGVDKNFKMLEDLEKEIKKVQERILNLPSKVNSLDEDVKYLIENKPKADQAVEQVYKMNDIMVDIEDRTKKLLTARQWLARTETRLETLGKNAQDQLKLLQSLMKDEGHNGKKAKGAPPPDKRQMIVKLSRQGWDPKEISKATNTSMGEVELILELEPKKR